MQIRRYLLSLFLATFLLLTDFLVSGLPTVPVNPESHRPEMMNDNQMKREIGGRLAEGEDDAIGDESGPEGLQWLGLGVLSNMQQFFDNLKENLDALETLPAEEKETLLSTQPSAGERHRDRAYRPSATAAYLNALRTHHPSYKIRNFVESPEPVSYRGTNRYDPSLMWTGLGRRKR